VFREGNFPFPAVALIVGGGRDPEARYQWTTEADLAADRENLDNYRVMFKVGKFF
jgi:hypothetical protein